MSKIVKILGTGCGKCQQLVSVVHEVISENQLEATVQKVEDITEIMEFNVMTTPALVVDEVVVVSGRIPSKEEILRFLN